MGLIDTLEAQERAKRDARMRFGGAALGSLLSAEDADTSAWSWRRVRDNFDLLCAAPGSVAELRKAVLQLAVQGKLVPQDTSDTNWKEVSLQTLLRENSRNGLSSRPSDSPPGVPILRISAATSRHDAIVDESDYKYLEVDEADLKKYALESDDLLACRFNGNLHYVGRFALYLNYSDETRLYPDKLIRFRVDDTKVIPKYVCLAMNSSEGRKKIESYCATTAGNIGISATNLKTVMIPLPPLNEQKRIVAKVDELMGLIDALEEGLKRAQGDAERLLEAAVRSLLTRNRAASARRSHADA